MPRPHCVGPQTHTQETHTLSVSFSLSPPFSFPYHLSLQKTATPPILHHHTPSPLSPASSGLQSYLLTSSESFVTSFQFLTFQLQPRLLPPSANKQENALSEKTVVRRGKKSQKRKVGVFDKYILRERPLILSAPPPPPSSTPLSLCLSFSNSLLCSAVE